MFKTVTRPPSKGEATRQHVLETALGLFRRRGFERTTMRDIARASGLSLGAAYHYFRSKDALVRAYFEWMQTEHERRMRAACPPGTDSRTRLTALFHTKLELLRRDRKLLAALYGHLGDASHPLSVFSRKTSSLRERSIAGFTAAFDDPSVPEDARELLGPALWLAHLGVFLFFIHDTSRNQVRTRQLVSVVVDLVSGAAPLLAHPASTPLRRRVLDLMSGLRPPRKAAR